MDKQGSIPRKLQRPRKRNRSEEPYGEINIESATINVIKHRLLATHVEGEGVVDTIL